MSRHAARFVPRSRDTARTAGHSGHRKATNTDGLDRGGANMATELVRWCDDHLSREPSERVPANADHVVTVDGSTYDVDLCNACFQDYLAPLVGWLRSRGVEAKASKSKAKRDKSADDDAPPKRSRPGGSSKVERHPDDDGVTTVCPICGATSPNRQGLASHGTFVHGSRALFGLFELAASLPVAEDGKPLTLADA